MCSTRKQPNETGKAGGRMVVGTASDAVRPVSKEPIGQRLHGSFCPDKPHPQAGVALQTFHLVETLIDGHADFLAGNVHALADLVMISSGLNVCRKSFDIFLRFSIELGLLVSFCRSKTRFHSLEG